MQLHSHQLPLVVTASIPVAPELEFNFSLGDVGVSNLNGIADTVEVEVG